jgi:hypothetical protein
MMEYQGSWQGGRALGFRSRRTQEDGINAKKTDNQTVVAVALRIACGAYATNRRARNDMTYATHHPAALQIQTPKVTKKQTSRDNVKIVWQQERGTHST